MIKDSLNELSDKQEVLTSAASENVIDQGAPGDAVLAPYLIVACVADAAVASGSASIQVSLQSSDDEAFTNPEEAFSSKDFAVTEVKAGKKLVEMRLPPRLKRYLRVYYTVTGTMTAGKYDAFLTRTIDTSLA